jgi:hypothetical protein
MSAQIKDLNGYIEIKNNPITKVGVFEYSGRQIDQDGTMGLDPDKIYNVYRSEEELSKPETIASFRGLPLIDDHEMLGVGIPGLMAPEEKGVHGVTGSDVRVENGYMLSTLRIFSEKLKKLNEDGKKDLSAGYYSVYDIESGNFKGQPYEIVQRQIRGNHLALVGEGRSGPDVSVLDHFKFTFDSKEIANMADEKKDEKKATDESVGANSLEQKLDQILTVLSKLVPATGMDSDEDKDKKETKDADEEKKDVKDADEADKDKKDTKDAEEKKDKAAMDARLNKFEREISELKTNGAKIFAQEIEQKNALVDSLSRHIGTFDSAARDKSLTEIAQYGLKELGITAPAGQELTAINSFLAGVQRSGVSAYTQDAAEDSEDLDDLFTGGSK